MTTGFDFPDLVDEAVERSGGEQSTAGDVLKIRRGLRILLERWEAQGYNTWRHRTVDVQPIGTTAPLKLPDNVDDVVQITSIRGQSETSMTRISPHRYMLLTNKGTKGRPSQWWLERSDPPQLNIFPVGTRDADLLRVYYIERPAEFTPYEDIHEDVPGRWLEALVTGLALDLARKRPPYNEQLIARLKSEAAEAEMTAQRADRNRVSYRYRISM